MQNRGLIVSAFILLVSISAFGQESQQDKSIRFAFDSSTIEESCYNDSTSPSQLISFCDDIKNENMLELGEIVTVDEIDTVTEPFYMSIKNNMLYDVIAIPNIGIEFYLGKNWSINANWMYAWWKQEILYRYWRIYGGELSLRKWFGKRSIEKPLTGHHFGIYGQAFTYDFQWGDKGYLGGEPNGTLWDKANFAVGVEYGYSLPIAKRLNLDFNLGVGYWGGKYYEYVPQHGHNVWTATKYRTWIGPIKAEISLVWLLGNGNINNR